MLNTKLTLVEVLLSMPDVGDDADFSRVEGSTDKSLAARQMQKFMASTPCVEQVDVKALIEDGRAGGEIFDAMIAQMNKMTTSAEAAIDNAPAEVDTSSQQIGSMDRNANGKAT